MRTRQAPRPRQLERYLLSGERTVVAVRHHWIRLLEPWASAIAALLVAGWLAATVADAARGRATDVVWWLAFAVVGRAIWRTIDHRDTWFVATDRRLLLIYGLLTRKVAMMPLPKVTDMTYRRSIPGRILGYGTFVLESAGQEQALHTVDHVPDPDDTYRAIIGEIFAGGGDDADDADDVYDDDAYATDEDDPTRAYALRADSARWRTEPPVHRVSGRDAGTGRDAADPAYGPDGDVIYRGRARDYRDWYDDRR